MKHKHCDLIKAWADGAEVQQRHPFDPTIWEDIEKFPSWSDNMEYRIKPKTIKYRVALFHDKTLGIVDNECDERHFSENRYFSRWLGDWQEVEV